MLKATHPVAHRLRLTTYWTMATCRDSLDNQVPGEWSYGATLVTLRGQVGGEYRLSAFDGRLSFDAGVAMGYHWSRIRSLLTRQVSPAWNQTTTTAQGLLQSFTFAVTPMLTNHIGLSLQVQVLGAYDLWATKQDSIFQDGYGPVPYWSYRHYTVDPYGQGIPCIGLQLGLTYYLGGFSRTQ